MSIPSTNVAGPDRGKRTIVLIIAVVAIIGIFVVTLSLLNRIRQSSSRVPDAQNLKQIGLALILYANDHGGIVPERLADLVAAGMLDEKHLRCHAPADPRFATYVFAPPPGVVKDWKHDDIVAFDWLENHDGNGMTALHGDGHVGWYPREEALKIIAQHAAGTRPIRLPTLTTQPAR